MAKAQTSPAAAHSHKDGGEHDWEASDAMHTLMRAGEIIHDKPLLMRVRKRAAAHATKMSEVAKQASQLAKRGAISEAAMAKLARRSKA